MASHLCGNVHWAGPTDTSTPDMQHFRETFLLRELSQPGAGAARQIRC